MLVLSLQLIPVLLLLLMLLLLLLLLVNESNGFLLVKQPSLSSPAAAHYDTVVGDDVTTTLGRKVLNHHHLVRCCCSISIRLSSSSSSSSSEREEELITAGSKSNNNNNNNNQNNITTNSSTNINTNNKFLFEVVGASGRIGSLFLRQSSRSIAVPRGIAPGCLSSSSSPSLSSSSSSPIVVATPSRVWDQIRRETLPHRRSDLVLIGNGLIPPPPPSQQKFVNTTIVVPHFGILKAGDKPITTTSSPPTYVYGRHANFIEQILRKEGITNVEIVNSFEEIQKHAAYKLLWASCMWLLCHHNDNHPHDHQQQQQSQQPPSCSSRSSSSSSSRRTTTKAMITVSQVHEQKQYELEKLVDELLPALDEIIMAATTTTTTGSGRGSSSNNNRRRKNEILKYLRSYSMSIPDAIPSKELAIQEIQERNGVWLSVVENNNNDNNINNNNDCLQQQPFHRQLLEEVAGSDALKKAQQQQQTTVDEFRRGVYIPELGADIVAWGNSKNNGASRRRRRRSAIVVGAGITGCSIALNMARRGMKVTVIDSLPDKVPGKTTPASWAWINANQKHPLSYRWLNMLGMGGWRSDEALKSLPVFCGSLVQYHTKPNICGGYLMEGPLTSTRINELEPYVNFTKGEGHVYFFEEEGYVDPIAAVQCLRRHCESLGVDFYYERTVTQLHRNDDDSKVIGVSCCTSSSDVLSSDDTTAVTLTNDMMKLEADTVLVAAGIGASSKSLGGLPLSPNPGQVVYAKSKSAPGAAIPPPVLSRLVVDTIRESHVLQRPDGTIVAGGGFLELGGRPKPSSATPNNGNSPDSKSIVSSDAELLLRVAGHLAPEPVGSVKIAHSAQASRPIPKDGLPAIGFLEDGLYVAVTHSGVTLSPVIGAAVATELSTGMQLDLLEPYRPARLFQD